MPSHRTLGYELLLLSIHQILHTLLLKEADLIFLSIGSIPGIAVTLTQGIFIDMQLFLNDFTLMRNQFFKLVLELENERVRWNGMTYLDEFLTPRHHQVL